MGPIILIIFGILIVAGFFFLMPVFKLQNKMYKKTGKYPEGHFYSQGIALGMALGLPLGLSLGNMALGPGFGLAIGVAIGKAMEDKNKDKIRPLTQEEKEMRKRTVIFSIVTLVAGICVFIWLLLMPKN